MSDAAGQALAEASDAELIHACSSGEEAVRRLALNTLYHRHRPRLLRIAHNYADNDASAEDAVQDTFEYLLRRLPPEGPGFRLTSKLSTLLYVVVEHAALAAKRRASRCASCGVDPDELPAPEEPHPENFEALIDLLPPAQRETMRLRFGEDCPYCEIADRLGVPTGTVKSRIHHAMETLRKLATAHELPV